MKAVFIFENLGPYHVARLTAASKLFDILAIETHSRSQHYEWLPANSVPFRTAALDRDRKGRDVVALRGLLKAAEPDVIFVPGWSSQVALQTLAWARLYGVPSVVMSDSQAIDFERGAVTEAVKRLIVRRFSAAFVGGQSHASYVIHLGMCRSAVMCGYDAVDNEYFARGAAAARADEENLRHMYSLPKQYFLLVARFIDKKNISGMLSAFAAYRRANIDKEAWDLVLVGDGPLRPVLEQKVLELGLAQAVHFLGFRQYHETPIFLGLAEALILPSMSEQWGLVVNEAMAAGLPVLVSDRCGCARDLVIDGETGFVFDPTDEESIFNSMQYMASLTSSTRARMGISAQKAVQEFSLQVFASNAALLGDLAAGTPRRRHLIDACLLRLLSFFRKRG